MMRAEICLVERPVWRRRQSALGASWQTRADAGGTDRQARDDPRPVLGPGDALGQLALGGAAGLRPPARLRPTSGSASRRARARHRRPQKRMPRSRPAQRMPSSQLGLRSWKSYATLGRSVNPGSRFRSSASSGPATNPACTPLPYTPPTLALRRGRTNPRSGAKSRLTTERPASPSSSAALKAQSTPCLSDTPPRKPGRALRVSSAPAKSSWVPPPWWSFSRKPLVPLAPADQHLVRGGLESDGEAQETLEGGGRRAASIEAEHELVEVGLEVLS